MQQRDKARKNYIISQGYKFVAIQQCQFISKIKPKCLRFYEHYLPSYYRKNKGDLTHSKILTDVKNGRLFGALEVDIQVEEGHEDFFQEYPPFFATCEVPMEAIGSHMLSYCNANDIQFKSKRLLISGLKARKILLATPLLQWYLKNKCQVSKIYQIIEFQPKPSFTSFIDKVTHHRIQGELEADKAIIGDTFKLISNSSYGSFLMNKTKHSNVRYLLDKNKVRKIINSCIFKDMQDINGVFEVETYKSRIVMDNPIQIGFFILQYAKLRMLEFYYDCLLKYLRPQSFELTETDTDSLYMAINQSDLDLCVRERHRQKYHKEIFGSCSDEVNALWFPRRCCSHHITIDKKIPGIFKKEFSGFRMLSLCSKSYIIEDQDGKQKISSKGISKKNLTDAMAKFSHTLSTGETSFSTNLGFRMRDANMFTYSQTKIGFNYFYCKREVQDDGITTRPLNITLSPWERESLVVSEVQDPLSNLYYSQMMSRRLILSFN